MSDRDHGYHRRYDTDPPRYDQYHQQSPSDVQHKGQDAYLTTISPRSHGTGSSTVEDDARSATHSIEIHPQYRGFKAIYYNPVIQVFFLGFVCFMGPGLFNALNGLGGGGMLDATTSANANSALYATFAVAAFFAG